MKAQDRSPRGPAGSRGPIARAWLYSFVCHTLDLPEWKMFPSEAERDRAIADAAYGRMPGLVGRLSRPLPLALCCLFVLVVVFIGLAPLTPAVVAAQWHPLLSLGVYFGIGAVFIVFVHRPAVARFLRGRLSDLGVPICRGCGYDLQGQAARSESGVCPECGREWRAFIEEARRSADEPNAP